MSQAAFQKISTKSRSAARRYSVTNVRPVKPGGHSTASMINSHGQIVGHGAEEPKTDTRAYAWSSEYGLVPDLGSVYGQSSFATNINDKGVIVGYMGTTSGSLRAYLLGQGQMYDLGLLSSIEYDEAFSVATDINNNGQVVGYSHNSENSLHAFIWDHETGMVDLGNLGHGRSYAYAISDLGTVVGWSQVDSKAGYRAFSWTREYGMKELPGKTGQPTVAYSINSLGTVCGSSAVGGLGNLLQATLWTDQGLVDVGSLPHMAFSSAQSLNDVGQLVGWSYPSAGCELKHGRAIIWDQNQGIQDLNDLVPRDAGWILYKATGINNDGEIVGCGLFDGKQQSFLLTPEGYARNVDKLLQPQQLSLFTHQKTGVVYRTIMIKNISYKVVRGPLHLVFVGLPAGVKLLGSAGEVDGHPFRTVNTDHLSPGSQLSTTVQFSIPNDEILNYDIECYAGFF